MKTKLKRKAKEIAEKFLDFRNWISLHWVAYTFIKNTFFFSYFALLIYAIGISNELASLAFVILIIAALIFFPLDSKRGSVACENPKAYLKSEKIEVAVERLFFFFVVLMFVFMISIVTLDRIDLEHWIKPYLEFVITPSIILMAGTAIAVEMKLAEIASENLIHTLSKIGFLGFLRKQSFLQFTEFAVHPTLQTRARFCVVLEAICQDSSIRTINRRLSLFKKGISIYNNHIREKFDFILHEPNRFYKYAKLAAHSKDSIEDVRKGLKALIEQMEKKDDDPFEVIRLLKNMMKESTSTKSVFDEIDVEPKPFRKWFSVHSDSIKIVFTFASLIISVLLAIMK